MAHDSNSPNTGENRDENIPADMFSATPAPQEDCTEDLNAQLASDLAVDLAKVSADARHDSKKAHAKGVHSNPAERRGRRRAAISAPVRVRNVCATVGPDEVTTTLDVSRNGLLIKVSDASFYRGMEVAVTFPYTRVKGVPQAEQMGRVVRINEMPGKGYSVAIALEAVSVDIINAQGKRIERCEPSAADRKVWENSATNPKKPMVLVVDADTGVRMTCKTYLEAEGYEVIAVGTADEAHEVLAMFTPALVIAEIEGPDLPGYELCAHIKGTPRLQTTPVLLLTSSAYPSDYANAHSLGAVVCMAKPFRQERLGHVVRLLAPTANAKMQTAMACTPDPQRKTVSGKKEGSAVKNPPGRFRLRSPW